MIYFMNKISQVFTNDYTSKTKHDLVYFQNDFSILLNKIKNHLRESMQEYPFIGTLSLSMNNLGEFIKDEELWLIMGDYIIDSRADTSIDEILNGIYGFYGLQNHPDFQMKIYYQLEYVLNLWDKSENPLDFVTLSRVIEIFFNNKNFNQEYQSLIERGLDRFIFTNTNHKEELNVFQIIKLCYHYANTTFKSLNYLQNVLNFLTEKFAHMEKINNKVFNGKTIAYSVSIIAESIKNQDILPVLINHELFMILERALLNSSVKYDLEDLIILHENMLNLEFDDIKDIVWLLDKKIDEIDQVKNLTFVKNFLNIRFMMYANANAYGFQHRGTSVKLEDKYLSHLDKLSMKIFNESKPNEIFNLVSWLEQNSILYKFQEILFALPGHVINHINHYDFEQMCFCYMVFFKHKNEFDSTEKQKYLKYNMDVLKDYIKMYYFAIPRGKLDINSNYYKILELVDIGEFYEKGSY